MNTLDRRCSFTKKVPCSLWWMHQAEFNRIDLRNAGDAPKIESKPHLRPCNCYMHLDGLEAFENVAQPLIDGYTNVVVQLPDGHVGRINQMTGVVAESWVPYVTPLEQKLSDKHAATQLPDPY